MVLVRKMIKNYQYDDNNDGYDDNDNDGDDDDDDDDDNCFMWRTMVSAAPLYVAPWADRPHDTKTNNVSSSSYLPSSSPGQSPWVLAFETGCITD